MSLLEIRNLTVYYGSTLALEDVSVEVDDGKVTCVLGSNGAGKSTLFMAALGLVKKGCGSVYYQGIDVTNQPTYSLVRSGITLCPEGRRLFPEMTVDENIRMGCYLVRDKNVIRDRKEFVHELFPRVVERAKQQASSLSGGEQQMVAIARALMSDPKVLFLDEPTLGLAPVLIQEVMQVVRSISRQGISVVLVEQNARQALRVSDQAYVLETGALVKSGPSHYLLDDPDIQKIYLGG